MSTQALVLDEELELALLSTLDRCSRLQSEFEKSEGDAPEWSRDCVALWATYRSYEWREVSVAWCAQLNRYALSLSFPTPCGATVLLRAVALRALHAALSRSSRGAPVLFSATTGSSLRLGKFEEKALPFALASLASPSAACAFAADAFIRQLLVSHPKACEAASLRVGVNSLLEHLNCSNVAQLTLSQLDAVEFVLAIPACCATIDHAKLLELCLAHLTAWRSACAKSSQVKHQQDSLAIAVKLIGLIARSQPVHERCTDDQARSAVKSLVPIPRQERYRYTS